MTKIRTVLGDIAPDEAGITLTHEHILYANPGVEFDRKAAFDFDTVADEVATTMKAGMEDYGVKTIVDMTAAELGRYPQLIQEVSRRSGVHLVAITGFFPERIGIPYHWRVQSVDYIRDHFISDITEGMAFAHHATDVKAGAIKVATGSGDWKGGPSPNGPDGTHMTPVEVRILRAAGRAQAQLGCCINTHTEPQDYSLRNAGVEQLDLLESEGADPGRIIIGHPFVNLHMDQLLEICERGANLQIDHIGIPWQNPSAEVLDEAMANAVCELAAAGYIERLVLTYDRFFHHCRGPVSEEEPEMLNERVDFGYMFDSFIPRLSKKGFTDDDVRTVLVDNPARLLAF
jgi:phosphotriesterase-related protein